MDEGDICQTARIKFTDGVATHVYGVDTCNCDVNYYNWFVGLALCDPESCAALCDDGSFAAACGPAEQTCDEVTIY